MYIIAFKSIINIISLKATPIYIMLRKTHRLILGVRRSSLLYKDLLLTKLNLGFSDLNIKRSLY